MKHSAVQTREHKKIQENTRIRKTQQAGELNKRVLNIHADIPDLRDRYYEPALRPLKLVKSPKGSEESPILDQQFEGACVGFALAAVVNLLNRQRKQLLASTNSEDTNNLPDLVSERMLYEMAKLHDEWPGETYEGSSIRGGLKGLYHNGACSNELAPYRPNDKNWSLTVNQAKDARKVGLGAYYRLRPEIIDYHAALNEVDAIIVAGRVHRGWQNPKNGIIKKSETHEGGHAFAIVGYDQSGFLIQNSWGEDWGGFNGQPGIAHWSYEDWAANIFDAWVLRLSVPTPESFDITHTNLADLGQSSSTSLKDPSPKRADIIGHLIHIDDGKLVTTGRYGTDLATLQETAKLLKEDSEQDTPKYDHLMFYCHGGLNSSSSSAQRVKTMKPVFKRNGIYPIHFMWETGFMEELADILSLVFKKNEERVGGALDFWDWTIEKIAKVPGRAIWREMKRDAIRAFTANAGGFAAMQTFLTANAQSAKPKQVHFIGHSAGSILIAELLQSMSNMELPNKPISSCNLMAPACTVDLYNQAFKPNIGKSNTPSGIKQLMQYNLIDQRELDDSVGPYRKSLLYFVSNAFEEADKMPLLGMETFSEDVQIPSAHKIWYAGRDASKTESESHGGFDNDRKTMNNILATILGKKPPRDKSFQKGELVGY